MKASPDPKADWGPRGNVNSERTKNLELLQLFHFLLSSLVNWWFSIVISLIPLSLLLCIYYKFLLCGYYDAYIKQFILVTVCFKLIKTQVRVHFKTLHFYQHGFEPGIGKIPQRRKWQPLQCSCLGNPMDRRAWQATVHGPQRVGDNLATKTNNNNSALGYWCCNLHIFISCIHQQMIVVLVIFTTFVF